MIYLYIFQIQHNASEIKIIIEENEIKKKLIIKIEDNGDGISKQDLKNVINPFFSTKHKEIGLGLSLFSDLCQLCDGKMEITSTRGTSIETKKTIITGYMNLDSINLLDFGKIEDTIISLILMNPNVDLYYSHTIIKRLIKDDNKSSNMNPKYSFVLDCKQIKRILKDIPIQDYKVLQWLKKYIKNGIEKMKEGL